MAERPLKHPILRKRAGGKAHIIRNWKKGLGRKAPEPPIKKKKSEWEASETSHVEKAQERTGSCILKFLHLMKERLERMGGGALSEVKRLAEDLLKSF